QSTGGTQMRPYRKALLDVGATPAASLRREARGDSDHLMTSSLSLVGQDTEKRAPTRIADALGKVVVLDHASDVQVLDADATVPQGILVGGFEVEVAPLARDLQVPAGHFTRRFTAAMAAFGAAREPALPVRQAFVPPAMVARILDDAAIGVRQKHFQAHVQP